MSSIIIKGMQMPSECRECPLCQYYPMIGETRCRRTGEVLASGFGTIKFSGRSEHCQLAELPEKHGRLIDADALIRDHFSPEHRIALSEANKTWMRKIINDAPTIVEAEGKCE